MLLYKHKIYDYCYFKTKWIAVYLFNWCSVLPVERVLLSSTNWNWHMLPVLLRFLMIFPLYEFTCLIIINNTSVFLLSALSAANYCTWFFTYPLDFLLFFLNSCFFPFLRVFNFFLSPLENLTKRNTKKSTVSLLLSAKKSMLSRSNWDEVSDSSHNHFWFSTLDWQYALKNRSAQLCIYLYTYFNLLFCRLHTHKINTQIYFDYVIKWSICQNLMFPRNERV